MYLCTMYMYMYMCVYLRFIWRQQHAQFFYSVIDVEPSPPLNCIHKHYNSKIILINAHYKRAATVHVYVNSLTCVVVVLFLSFLFKVFAVYCGRRGKSRKGIKFTSGVQMVSYTYMYVYTYDNIQVRS